MKKKLSELEPLVPTLWALQRLIDRFESRGIVIGGAAICLLGQPRLTADVDAMLEVRAERAKTLGLPPPLPYRQVTSPASRQKAKMTIPKAVLDSNVIVSALLVKQGKPAQIILLAQQGHFLGSL